MSTYLSQDAPLCPCSRPQDTCHNPLALGSSSPHWEMMLKPWRGGHGAEGGLGQYWEGQGLEDVVQRTKSPSQGRQEQAEWWKIRTKVLKWKHSGCVE